MIGSTNHHRVGGAIRLAGAALLGLVLSVATAPAVAAQDHPVVFQHGLSSDGSTWSQTASRLREELKIKYVTPSLNTCQTYGTQAGQLPAQIDPAFGPISGIGFVGHSNGGIISREFHRQTGRDDRVITVGSPHHGAPLAENWLNGEVAAYGAYFAGTIGSVFGYYNFWDPSGAGIPPGVDDIFAPALYWFGQNLPGLMYNLGLAIDPATHLVCPVIEQMVPGSTYLSGSSGLNAPANLGAEQAGLTARVSVRGRLSPYDAVFYVLFGRNGAGEWIFARNAVHAGAVAAFIYYHFSPDWMLSSRADDWLAVAALMVDIDAWWAWLNGSLVSYTIGPEYPINPEYVVYDGDGSDGVVPLASQAFPSQTTPYLVLNVAHTWMTTDEGVRNALELALENDFQIPRRPFGSVASVTISPASATVAVGNTTALTAKTYDVHGIQILLKPVTWSTSNAGVATVSVSGVVTGIAQGTAVITAASEGYSSTSTITVLPGTPFTSVSISGPYSVDYMKPASFTAITNGGSPPFQFDWYVDGVLRQSGPAAAFSYTSDMSYTLTLHTTDSQTVLQTATRSVDVAPCGGDIAC